MINVFNAITRVKHVTESLNILAFRVSLALIDI
jgi:hypothetical protein